MIRKGVFGFDAAAALCFTGILIYQRNWILVSLWGIFLGGIYYLWNDRQKAYIKELGEISGYLDDLLQKKEIAYRSVQEDTLTGKIASQIGRAERMYGGLAKLLEEERDSLKQSLAEIAHQLRTPLANMETYFALLEDPGISGKEKDICIKSMGQAERKLSFLIERFIVSARLENRIIQIHKHDTDLKETVAQAVFQVYRKADEKNINIKLQGDNIEKDVLHDRNWICEAVYNLLDNSIKYSPDSSDIIIDLIDNEMFSEIKVEDFGTGIKKGEDNNIFQLYYRGSNISDQEGYGMGLFITREIIQKHGGYIKAKRKENGLIMSVVLPKAGT